MQCNFGREKRNAACRANNLTMNTDFIHQLRRLLSQTNKLWKAYQLQLLTSSKSRRGMGWGCIFIGFLGQLAIYIIHSSLNKVGNPNFWNKNCQSKKKGGNYLYLLHSIWSSNIWKYRNYFFYPQFFHNMHIFNSIEKSLSWRILNKIFVENKKLL